MPPPKKSGVDPGDHERIRRKLPGYKTALARELKRALARHGDWWFGRMVERFRAPLVPYGQVNTNRTLHNRTGALRNSLHKKVLGTQIKDLALRLSSDSPYARLQEYGGVIRPRRAKYLTIPVDDNLTPAGARRYKSPRSPGISHGRFVKLPSGTLWYVAEKDGDVKFLFALRKEVDIPGPGPQARRKMPSRLGMIDTATGPESRRELRRRLVQANVRALEAFTGGSAVG